MTRASGRKGGSRVASFFVLLGCVAVLGGTFGLGVMTGRRWPARPPESAAVAKDKDARPGAKRGSDSGPTLTFYQELTAPLTSPPPPPRHAKGAEPRADKTDKAASASATTERPSGERYTIQVAAYRQRAQAEALRDKLAGAGHEAYVVDGEGPGGVHYRVRLGSFATREAAQAAAARIAREQSLTAFVTTR